MIILDFHAITLSRSSSTGKMEVRLQASSFTLDLCYRLILGAKIKMVFRISKYFREILNLPTKKCRKVAFLDSNSASGLYTNSVSYTDIG